MGTRWRGAEAWVPPGAPAARVPFRLVLVGILAGCAPVSEKPDAPPIQTCQALPSPALDDVPEVQLSGLSGAWRTRYRAGESAFEAIYRESTGLGPAYIHVSCAACHAGGGRGPKDVTKMVVMDGDAPAADQSALPWGHTVRPEVAGGATTPILPPDDVPGLLVTVRHPNALWGRGYLEAIADAEIEAVEAEQAAAGVVSGRINRIAWSAVDADSEFHDHAPGDVGLVGRFGHKARVATLDEFTADALVGDMSITSPLRPDEAPNPDGLTDDARAGVDVTVETVNAVADYTRALDIPARLGDAGALTGAGAVAFADAGCADCHVPTLRTRADYPIPPLADIDAPVYSDLLLHDMGPALADGLEDGDAEPAEWRTAPLVGLRHLDAFLHDGRAATLEEAILAHDGEGAAARDAYAGLPDDARVALCGLLAGL